MYRLLRQTHLWIGLIAGLVFSVSGLSGSALVFDDTLDLVLHPGLWQVEPVFEPLRLDAATRTVRQAFPEHELRYARLPREPGHSIEYWLEGETIQRVYVDPWRLNILGVRDEHAGVLGFMHDLHVHLLSGDTGLIANGVIGFILLFMVVTGLYLAWPGWRRLIGALRIPRRRTRLVRWYALHRSTGLVSLLFLFIIALTGATMVFHETTNAALVKMFGGPAQPEIPKVEPVAHRDSSPEPESLLARARTALPHAQPTWLHFAGQSGEPFLVRLRYPDNPHLNGNSYVALDPHTGGVVMVHDANRTGAGQKLAHLKYPLHIGTVLGLPGQLIVMLSGLVPALLFVTGCYLWWHRRRPRSMHR